MCCYFSFPNLGIQHVTKKNVASILEERYLAAEMQLSSLNEGLSLDVQKAIKGESHFFHKLLKRHRLFIALLFIYLSGFFPAQTFSKADN